MENNIISDYNFNKWKGFVRSDNNSVLSVNKESLNAKLFTNMSEDSTVILFSSSVVFSDLNQNSVLGSLTLQPWSSRILISESDIENLPEINIAGGPLKFKDLLEKSSVSSLWFNLIVNNIPGQTKITAPRGFLISLKDDSDFLDTISFNNDNNKTDKIVFVKFDPDENKRYYDFITVRSGNIERKVKVTAD